MSPLNRTYKAELVFGIVCPLGTRYKRTLDALLVGLKQYGYEMHTIHISQAFPEMLCDLGLPPMAPGGVGGAIAAKIKAGDDIRRATGSADILAGHAIHAIAGHEHRPQPRERVAHVIVQLKRPEEIDLLRGTYGQGFFLIGISSSHAERMRFFADNGVENEAATWIEADGDEKSGSGQLTSKTFHLADVFISSSECKEQLSRFLELVFSSPFVTPTQDERGMFLAFASSMSSGDLSRQVGAALVGPDGDVVALGYNEVPKAGGGRYEGGEGSVRDMELGEDANHKERMRIAKRVLDRFDPQRNIGEEGLRDTGILSITEYGRAVHAEMDAILSCSRAGRSGKGATLYATTFPCHNCARHIIATGIRRVVFVEPYPQSRAGELHADAIALDGGRQEYSCAGDRIPFVPFIGIGPRRYIDLFSLRVGSGVQLERELNGEKRIWRPDLAGPRLPMMPSSYLERERLAAIEYENKLKKEDTP